MDKQTIIDTLPHRKTANGPVTRHRQRLTLLAYLTLCTLGLIPSLFGNSAPLQAAGLGLWFPGAGFLAVGGWHLLWLPVVLALFGLAMFAWFASGNVVAPVLVWLLAALGAAMATGERITPLAPYAVPMIVVVIAFLIRRASQRAFSQASIHRAARVQHLPQALIEVGQRALPVPAATERELDPRDLAATRFLFDRALQPAESLIGLDVIEQFQTSSIRYQLFDMQYSLAMLQCQYTPNFQGYLAQAQRNLIEKIVRPEIWGYWKWESLWGRLTTDYDPVVKDNIMLTGFYSICLNLYASNTGDHRYAEPGVLDFWLKSGQHYKHSTHSIANALVHNFDQSAYCLYPCEPNWIYTFCNLQGMTGLAVYDRVYGHQHMQRLQPRFVEHWREEFTTVDGNVLPIKSSLTGLTIPGLIGVSADASGSVLAGAVLPEIAIRMWAQVRQEAVRFDEAGRLHLPLIGADNMDPGNYRRGNGMAYTTVLFAANEYGDKQVAEAALRRLEEEYEPTLEAGALRYQRLSILTNSMMVRARIARRGDWRRTIAEGPAPETRNGPILAGASYPEVLVARAISDGSDLDLVLYPGVIPGFQRIGIERLQACRTYRIQGGGLALSLVADTQGKLTLEPYLDGRTKIHLNPET